MASTNVDIANRALLKLGDEGNLTTLSTSGDSKQERVLAGLYDDILKAVLVMFPWGFAKRRDTLTAHAEAPVWDYTGAFLLPSDCLRIIRVDGYDEEDEYDIEAHAVTTTSALFSALMLHQTADIKVVYIAHITDVTRFEPLFVEAFAAWLAHEADEPINQSNTKKEAARQDLELAFQTAKKTSARQQSSKNLPDSTWITNRDRRAG